MASEVIAFPVNLRKNKNQYSTAYGKYFPEADSKDPLNLKGFAKHLAEHGKLVDYPMAVLVLQNIVACLKEMIIQGQPVKLDGFGTFSPTLEVQDRKAQDSVEQSLALGLDNLIGGVHLRSLYPRELEGREVDLARAEGRVYLQGRLRDRVEEEDHRWQGANLSGEDSHFELCGCHRIAWNWRMSERGVSPSASPRGRHLD